MNEAMNVVGNLLRYMKLEPVIYLAILIVTVFAMLRCFVPLSRASARLRRASRIIMTEQKQNKEKKSWHNLDFLGSSLESVW